MMHDKADENIKIPDLFYTMGDFVFQWGAIYDVYFFFSPILETWENAFQSLRTLVRLLV